ncbi:MAG: sigma 54-interacting transcriptional regulator [Flavobacteriaceae bacterium]|nr:sigma 54-interacting transcriptional regulator [Flavobacteriaceae bacterium]
MNHNQQADISKFLRQHPFFTSVSDEILEELGNKMQVKEFVKHENIFKKGDQGDCMYFIQKGKVKIHDKDYIFDFLEKGNIFGEYSLIDNVERSASATAEDRVTLLQLNQSEFLDIMYSNKEFVKGVLDVMISRHREIDKIQNELFKSRNESQLLNKQLSGLLNGAMDAVIMFDKDFSISITNKAAKKLLENESPEKRNILFFFKDDDADYLESIINEETLRENKPGHVIPKMLCIIGTSGNEIHTEGTLSYWKLDEKQYYCLILRNIEERLQTEFELKTLSARAKNLEEEIKSISPEIGFVAKDVSMRKVLNLIDQVAHTDATVLIQGETGTGKELVAKAIHQKSQRANKPFIRINCGAIPANLIESELFGHVKGAFTGATIDRKGRFELADKGTLFLDEIGELPLELQTKFLRVLQEGEFEAVGSSETIKVDVRVLAATHRNMFDLVKKNEFREDLYYRLNVFPIQIPPLRERGNDVLLIAQELLNKFCQKLDKPFAELTEEEEEILKNYNWPGNVRELQNVMERAAILSSDGQINWSVLFPQSINEKVTGEKETHRIYTQDEILQIEKQNILKALKSVKWKISGPNGAAELLKMKPTTLSSKIKALGLDRPV